jgi:hypothetical protein
MKAQKPSRKTVIVKRARARRGWLAIIYYCSFRAFLTIFLFAYDLSYTPRFHSFILISPTALHVARPLAFYFYSAVSPSTASASPPVGISFLLSAFHLFPIPSLYLLADAINPSKQSDVKIRKYSNPRTTSCTHTSYRLIQLHLLPPQVTASSSGSTCYIETEHRRPYIRLCFAAFALRISGPALHGDSKKLQTRSRSLAGTLFGQL